jgi:pyridoxal phosphate enzyme (YggS family)|tara:strand:+ start:3112 stop:3762 length:651 start_codon:yes stop_codon:yes gene_type:complete
MNIANSLSEIKSKIPSYVTLVAVSKTKPVEDVEIAYKAGQLHFGENKIKELVSKHDYLPKNIKWHMIGHLQTNKVKYIAPFVHLIHSIDSVKLIKEVNKQAIKNNRIINVLIQIDISKDETKFGFSIKDFELILNDNLLSTFSNIKVIGLMGMASFTNDKNLVRGQFNSLKELYVKYKESLSMEFLSMGMSGDYNIAIECQSNLIRLGSTIFGKRK